MFYYKTAMMNNQLIELERKAIRFIRNAERLALRMNERGFHVAFSGGKDSQVLLALVEMAGVKHHAEMQVTTVDSPNLMKFVRTYYPQVHLNLPKLNMRQLILKKKMLPTRQARFCCAFLKEQAGSGCCTCTGIRRSESVKRAKRHHVELFGNRNGWEIQGEQLVQEHFGGGGEQLFETDSDTKIYCVNGKDKVIISPIFDWTDKNVWDFIKGNNMPYCDLYDMGFHRIGCLFCPMASVKEKRKELELFPRFAEKVYIRAIRELMEQTGNYSNFDSPEQAFEWWISNENAADWLSNKRNQQNLFNYDNH